MALGLKAHITLTDNLRLVSSTSVGQMMPLASIAGTCAHSHTQSHIHTYICILIVFFFTNACPENLKM